jgi:hypothetical protein
MVRRRRNRFRAWNPPPSAGPDETAFPGSAAITPGGSALTAISGRGISAAWPGSPSIPGYAGSRIMARISSCRARSALRSSGAAAGAGAGAPPGTSVTAGMAPGAVARMSRGEHPGTAGSGEKGRTGDIRLKADTKLVAYLAIVGMRTYLRRRTKLYRLFGLPPPPDVRE